MITEELCVNNTNPCPYCKSSNWGMYSEESVDEMVYEGRCLDVYAECGNCGRFFTITLFEGELEILKLQKKRNTENIPDIMRFNKMTSDKKKLSEV